MKYNWANELYKFYGKRAVILGGTDPKKFGLLTRSGDKVFIINYDVVDKWLHVLKVIDPEMLILDESQYIKTSTTKRTKACAELAYQARKFLALSGTPMMNSPIELYTTLNMIFKVRICSKWQFMNRYPK
jgi:SWI/SNF-related matrix-associated actin-dependent regulator 1 of chromatin subfamily A